ncbi:MAG: MFS transporter [Rhodospirillaceae bacterium]|nr:MFS transporter [Rhodospirillaceae bacterium]MBT3884607.1 MFS transporter [Rhodospirillaceae bacterium]MBT4115376.1 MFS transporter [Rhodospirillaceae bacterium]MBT4671748.1 MFS transporter [Rhodospirillaceae bacterium]MBT4720155.1 MFS transporter [Rhodospirillaceae bacterium]
MAEPSFLQRLGARVRTQGVVRVMRHGAYARFITSSWVYTIGFWMQRIGIGWLTWELTRSGAWLGAVAMAYALPAIILTPFAGAIADRMDRVRLLRRSQALQFLTGLVLAGFTLAGLAGVGLIIVIAFTLGILESMATPARMTIAPNLVPKEDLSGAIGLNAVSFNSATFIGPAIAGAAIAGIGVGWTFAISAAAFVPHYLVLCRTKLHTDEHRGRPAQSLIADIFEAVRYLALHRGIAPVLAAAMVGSLSVRHLPELMPGFAGDVFSLGPEGLGALMSAFGAGGMLGSLWMANRNRVQGTTMIFFVGLMGNAVFVFAFAATDIFLVGLASLAMFGFSMSTSGNGSQILIQTAVAGSLRARAMSLYSLTFRGGPAIGALVFGGLSTSFGLQAPVMAGAVVCFVIAAAIMVRRRVEVKSLMEKPSSS